MIMRRRSPNRIFVILTVVLFMFSGCRVNRPDDVMSPKHMEDYLYDYHLAQAIVQTLDVGERYKSDLYFNWVYDKNGVTKKQVETSLVWYTRYPKELSKVYERLSARIEKERTQSASMLEKVERKSFSVLSGDSVDLWYLRRTSILIASEYMNKITFNILADSSFHYGDDITWNIGSTFFGQDRASALSSAYLSMSIYYKDSISTVDTIIDKSGINKFYLSLDDSITPNSIGGSITYMDPTRNPERSLLLNDMYIIRKHRKGKSLQFSE